VSLTSSSVVQDSLEFSRTFLGLESVASGVRHEGTSASVGWSIHRAGNALYLIGCGTGAIAWEGLDEQGCVRARGTVSPEDASGIPIRSLEGSSLLRLAGNRTRRIPPL
jgi:hypothetical protein